jgi:hypothetical protein
MQCILIPQPLQANPWLGPTAYSLFKHSYPIFVPLQTCHKQNQFQAARMPFPQLVCHHQSLMEPMVQRQALHIIHCQGMLALLLCYPYQTVHACEQQFDGRTTSTVLNL